MKAGEITERCDRQLEKAARYIAKTSPRQAGILYDTFEEKVERICQMPGIGTLYKNGMRRFKLGKFRYNIFYRETKDKIFFLGIHHTSRGTEFHE